MIKYTIVIVSGERPEWFSMRWLSACRLLCYFSMTCKSASFHQSQSRLSAEWCVKMTMTTPKDEEGKIWMTSAQKQIHFYVSKKDKSFLYWIQTGFQCLCPSVGHLLVHHNVTCKNACKKKTRYKIQKHTDQLWWQCFKGATNKWYNNSWDMLVTMAVLVVLRLCTYLFFLALMAWFIYWFSLSSFFIGTSLLHEPGSIPQPKAVCTARLSRLSLRAI